MARPRMTASSAPGGTASLGSERTKTTLATGGDSHVPADQESQPAKHLLLCYLLLVCQQLPDPVSEFLVVSHRRKC